MTRTVPEWIGKTDDAMPPPTVKDRIVQRQDQRCAKCGVSFKISGNPDFDHRIPIWAGGKNRETNIRALCKNCHGKKTRKEASQRSEAKRHRMKAAGIKRKTRKIPYRLFDGTIVWPD